MGVRETSRKPDEIYNLIERMFPNCLKLELFGRPHNVHENWVTLGNQLDGVRLCDEELVRRYNMEFPDNPTELWKREREAVVPVNVADSGRTVGAAAGVWKPPSSSPPPTLALPAPPSSADAWVPPSAPPTALPEGEA